MRENHIFAGEFFQSFIDETVVRKEHNNAYNSAIRFAPDCILGPGLEKEGIYFALKDICFPVHSNKIYNFFI